MYQPLLFKSCKRLTLTVVKATTAGPNEIISMGITTLLESVKFSPPNNATTKNKNKDDTDEWVRVTMLKSGIVNGVRFPEGVVIDVSKTDAEKLESDGLILNSAYQFSMLQRFREGKNFHAIDRYKPKNLEKEEQ